MSRSRQYQAVNAATSSKNLIHDDDGARRHGLARALVPATGLLAYVLIAVREELGPEWGEQGSAVIRFSAPVYNGQLLEVGAVPENDGVAVRLTAADSAQAAVTGRANLSASHYFGRRPQLASLTGLPSRPMTGGDLIGDERLNSMAVDTSLEQVADYAQIAGLDSPAEAAGIPTEFLIASYVRYLKANFVRRQPSMYAGVQVHCLRRAEVGEPLEMRGRIDRLYSRKGRQFMMIESGWFDSDGSPVLWALHTSVYELGPAAG